MALLKNFTSGLKDIDALNDQKFINSSGKVENGMHMKKELAERGIKKTIIICISIIVNVRINNYLNWGDRN